MTEKKSLGDKIDDFFSGSNSWLLPVILILIAGFFAFNLRAQTNTLPITDSWAHSSVEQFYKNQIEQSINKQFPNLPDQNKIPMINDKYNSYLKQNKAKIDSDISTLSQDYKSHFKNEFGETYLVAIDPYYYLKKVRNIVDHGQPGEYLKDGKPFDALMRAPYGVPTNFDFHSSFGALWYKFVHFFSKDTSIMGSMFWIPILFMVLSIIPAFFIGKKIAGNLGGFISSFLVGIHPAALSRTIGGFADTDAYNIFFPLMIVWMFIEGFSSKDTKKKYIFMGLAAIFTGIYSFAWTGWFYIFDVLLATFGVYLIYELIKNKKNIRKNIFENKNKFHNLLSGLIYFFASGIFVTIILRSLKQFFTFITGPLSFLSIQSATRGGGIWPNVLTTVAELHKASLKEITNSMGGNILFFVAILGVILLFFRFITNKKSNKSFSDLNLFLTLLTIIWFSVMIYASFNGIRFTLLFVPIFSLAVGIGTALSINGITKFFNKSINIKPIVSKIILILILIMILLPVYNQAKKISVNTVPSMNDAWYNSLNKINQQSNKDAIINSWWDFGHWFKAIGQRRVTFDGASQGLPAAHWIGKVLTTNNEKEARGILQMLDCGANRAYEYLDNITNNSLKSIKIIDEIVPLSKTEAEKELLKQFTQKQVNQIINYSKCDAPEDYFITSQDMVGKAPVWAHFGLWNFTKAQIMDYKNKLNKNEFENKLIAMKYTQKDAEQTYYNLGIMSNEEEKAAWISPWPRFYTGVQQCPVKNNTITCIMGFQNNKVAFNINANTKEFIPFNNQKIYPEMLTYNKGNSTIISKKIGDAEKTIPLALNLIEQNGKYYGFLCDRQLTNSVFTRLFFYQGISLKQFNLFSYQQDLSGNKIFVWKVKW